ncbi:orotate phosphoribosyltransferase [Rhodomicrobium vannielii ATCC 17100]|jgi:orotate phosphoribosyltransferase|uniref:Orotate phosphoribosyltransferase n=1 Tax=Rhodomicrobium vannielii (strain ATCC 17100 / DSM 162 / LMG 4299 / NCIMB 10020 / ATH 3.1.1) TaxID=648757 RepID=E3I3S9_RHOVT|nr:orotate phosphoribosyltransferase [Rhodomicrobium vannielii]ADP71492.1 orotate phosphoribosyltransferase [Rhodomicrobium vannielii ATCC 17100]
MLTDDAVLTEFRDAGALLEGHFVLSSGNHSTAYLQCARVLMDAKRAERLCAALAGKIRAAGLADGIDLVVSPAMGGVVVGYEMGRQLGLPAIFFERVDGVFALRRGFRIEPGQRCIMVEDVVTTGLSSRECIEAAEAAGGTVVAAASLVDRSGGRAKLPVPFVPLIRLDIPIFPPDQIPASVKGVPPVKPGSRGLKV